MENDLNRRYFGRRDFLIRSAKAGLSVAAAGLIGYYFFDPIGPIYSSIDPIVDGFPDFSIPDLGKRMAIARGPDRIKTLQLAFKAIGGVESFIKSGDRVLLKVNAAFASPPILSATTHPQLVSEMARLCFKSGASKVVVTDNPINDPASCFALTGIARAAESAGAKVILPAAGLFKSMTIPGTRLIRNWPVLYEPIKVVDKVIGLAPVKDHRRSGASMTMKNWYGLLGGRRNIFHQDIHTIIKELAIMVKPSVVILDGTTTMMSNGPTGGSLSDLKETKMMIVSTDPVAADAFGATLLKKELHELSYITKAAAAGIGTADYRSINPVIASTD